MTEEEIKEALADKEVRAYYLLLTFTVTHLGTDEGLVKFMTAIDAFSSSYKHFKAEKMHRITENGVERLEEP